MDVVGCAGVCDYRVLGNRSRAFLAENKLDQAREDAELACRLHPFWAKVKLSIASTVDTENSGCYEQHSWLFMSFWAGEMFVILGYSFLMFCPLSM